MEKHEQRFVIKFFWIRRLAPSVMFHELQKTLHSRAYSHDSVENWVRRFVSGDTSCADLPRAGGRGLTDQSRYASSLITFLLPQQE
jgi:hypothetical protein